MKQETYQSRDSEDDSLIMTNKWSHVKLPAHWSQGQMAVNWEKNPWHVRASMIDGKYTGMRVVEKVLKLEKKKEKKVIMLIMKWLRNVSAN